MKKIKSMALAMILMGSLPSMAEKIVTVNGETVTQNTVKITLNGDNAVLYYDNGETLATDMSLLVVSFDDKSGLTSPSAQIYSANTVVNDKLFVSGLETDDMVSVFSAVGVLMMQQRVKGNSVQLDCDNLSGGIYFLKVNGKTIKFVKE